MTYTYIHITHVHLCTAAALLEALAVARGRVIDCDSSSFNPAYFIRARRQQRRQQKLSCGVYIQVLVYMYASSTLDLRLYLSGRTGHRARFPTALTTFFLHTGLASCESARALQNFAAKRAPACSPRLIFLVPREGLLLFTLLYLSYPSFRRRSGSPRETLGNSRLD